MIPAKKKNLGLKKEEMRRRGKGKGSDDEEGRREKE
jgi:hypothetical protein